MVEDIDSARLHKRLRELRETKKKNESIRTFAKNAGISYTHVAQMEGWRKKSLKGTRPSSPSALMLNRYLRYCGSSITQFFSEFEEIKPEGMKDEHRDVLETVRSLLEAGGDVERRICERVEEVQVWLRSQSLQEAAPAKPTRKRKAS
jgi:hypothetical protein